MILTEKQLLKNLVKSRTRIVARLSALDAAIESLRVAYGTATPKKNGHALSRASRLKMSKAQKKRWASKKNSDKKD